jgi:hypothetical protein
MRDERFLRKEGEMSARSSKSEWYAPERTPLGRTARGDGSKVAFVDFETQNPLVAPVTVYCSLSSVWMVR